MQTWAIPALREILGDLQDLLPELPIFFRRDEKNPQNIDLSFQPLSVPNYSKKSIVRKPEYNCTLCDLRISFKEGQFNYTQEKLPYLILVQNKVPAKTGIAFTNPKENALFSVIIEKSLSTPLDHFIIREVLRSQFSKNKENDTHWIENCRSHIISDIENLRIKGVLIVGQAATLLEGDLKKLREKAGKITQDLGIPTIYIPGPSRLLYLQRSHANQATILEEKRRIYQGLKVFKEKVMPLYSY